MEKSNKNFLAILVLFGFGGVIGPVWGGDEVDGDDLAAEAAAEERFETEEEEELRRAGTESTAESTPPSTPRGSQDKALLTRQSTQQPKESLFNKEVKVGNSPVGVVARLLLAASYDPDVREDIYQLSEKKGWLIDASLPGFSSVDGVANLCKDKSKEKRFCGWLKLFYEAKSRKPKVGGLKDSSYSTDTDPFKYVIFKGTKDDAVKSMAEEYERIFNLWEKSIEKLGDDEKSMLIFDKLSMRHWFDLCALFIKRKATYLNEYCYTSISALRTTWSTSRDFTKTATYLDIARIQQLIKDLNTCLAEDQQEQIPEMISRETLKKVSKPIGTQLGDFTKSLLDVLDKISDKTPGKIKKLANSAKKR